jgi:hypothetical protein
VSTTVAAWRSIWDDEPVADELRSFGSIIGTLEAVAVHDGHEVGLWTRLRPRRVTVRFGPELHESVSAALGKRVEASGTVWRNHQGVAVRLELRKIAVLPSRSQTPTLTKALDDLASEQGIFPLEDVSQLRGEDVEGFDSFLQAIQAARGNK